MDARSDVLRVVRLSGGVFLDAKFTAPWCISARVGPEDCRYTAEPPAGVIAFHYVIEGRMLLQVEGDAPVEVASGALVALQSGGGLARIEHGGGSAATRIVCGFVGCDATRHPLVEALPRVFTLDLNGKPCAEWVVASFRYAAQEVAAGRAGSETVLGKLSELLFVETVRGYVDTLPAERRGWLTALRDPAIGRALALLHARPAHAWTNEELASAVAPSRWAFAERFVQLLGVPPMSYLTSWRMQLAAARLRDTHRAIAQIAAETGYESEATFARAFKREIGVSPGRYRAGA